MRTKKVAIKKAKVTPAKSTKKVISTKKVVKAKAKPKAKKLKKYAVGGRKSNPCPAGYYWNGSECVEGQNTGGFGRSQAEYDRNIKSAMDADKELSFIARSKYNENNPIKNFPLHYGYSGTEFRENAPKYLKVSSPSATDASMAKYNKEIAAYYKANPNTPKYVGRLPIKKVESASSANKELVGPKVGRLPIRKAELSRTTTPEIRMAKGGKKTSVKKYAKGGTKTSVKRVVRRTKRK
jgi:hypothetical protein